MQVLAAASLSSVVSPVHLERCAHDPASLTVIHLRPREAGKSDKPRIAFRGRLVADRLAYAAANSCAGALSMTSQEPRAGFPLTLESKAVGLKKRSWIKISQIRTLSVDRIGSRVARASEEELARGPDGLNEIVG